MINPSKWWPEKLWLKPQVFFEPVVGMDNLLLEDGIISILQILMGGRMASDGMTLEVNER